MNAIQYNIRLFLYFEISIIVDMKNDNELIRELALKAIEMASNSSDLERYCWMILHKYHHGVMPVEYDIKEIDENLYLNILKYAKNEINNLEKDKI